jgi:hypothetical protein
MMSTFSAGTFFRYLNQDIGRMNNVDYDSPEPAGLLYCMNADLFRVKFVEEMEKEVYGEYLKLFEK